MNTRSAHAHVAFALPYPAVSAVRAPASVPAFVPPRLVRHAALAEVTGGEFAFSTTTAS